LLVQLNNMHGALGRVPGPSLHGSSCKRFFYPPLQDIAVFAPALAAGASSFTFTCVRAGSGAVTRVLEFARVRQAKNAQVGSRNAAYAQQFTEGLWCESSGLDTVRPMAVRHFVQLAPRVKDVFLFDEGHLIKRPLEAWEASDLVDQVCDAEARLAHPVACTRHRTNASGADSQRRTK
jgi:hypothetical protein